MDAPLNGVCDPTDAPVPGITVTLNISPALVSRIQMALALFAQTTTDASGLYTFANVSDGMYFVHFDLPAGYQFSPMATGVNTVTNNSLPFSISAQNQNINVDAPLAQSPTAIDLAGFAAETVSAAKCGNPSGAECAQLSWQTLNESAVAGFQVVRSAGPREKAIPVGQGIVLAKGMAAEYSILDTNTQPGQTYTYWLVELNAAGLEKDVASVVVHVDGAVAVAPAPQAVFLPTPFPVFIRK